MLENVEKLNAFVLRRRLAVMNSTTEKKGKLGKKQNVFVNKKILAVKN